MARRFHGEHPDLVAADPRDQCSPGAAARCRERADRDGRHRRGRRHHPADRRASRPGYPLAGPEILTRTDLVRHLADALGRDIAFQRSSRENTITALTPAMGDTATWYVDNVLAGFDVLPTDLPITSVQDVTGRPATTFAQWAADNSGRFAGD